MPLHKTPDISQMTPEDFEPILTFQRTQRLRLQVEFQKQNNIRLGIQSKQTKEKVTKQMEILARELMSIDEKITKAQARLEKVQTLNNQFNRIEDLLNEDTGD